MNSSEDEKAELYTFKNVNTQQDQEELPEAAVKQMKFREILSKPVMKYQQPTSMAHYVYRIDKLNQNQKGREKALVNLLDFEKELEDNIRRKLELERKYKAQQLFNKTTQEKAVQAVKEADVDLQARKFAEIQIQRAKQSNLFEPIFTQKQKVNNIRPQSSNLKSKVPLDQVQLLKLSRLLTFPELPAEAVLTKCKSRLNILHQIHNHSDITYLLMVAHYHLDELNTVLSLFDELLRFKKFNPMGYWVASQTFFSQQLYEQCLKVCDLAVDTLTESIFPRLLYLKAKCSAETFRYASAIVLYNQLIMLCPKIPEYYLQRALIFEKSQMYDKAKRDFEQFRKLRPNWKDQLKRKVILETDTRKKEGLIAVLNSLKHY